MFDKKMPIIQFKDIEKKYDENAIITHFNLDIEKGEFLTVIGSSGCGKTTLLKMINGLLLPDNGSVLVNQKDIKNEDLIALRRSIGYCIQGSVLFPHMSVEDNISYVPNLLNHRNKKKTHEAVAKWMKIVGLTDDMRMRYPSELSGGQQQRVGIARALATDPEIIYFDEPTSALDPELIGEVLTVMKQLAEEGMTMLVVTHEMGFARNVSNKVVFMEDGRVLEQAGSREFFDNPREERIRAFLRTLQGEDGA